MKRFLSAVLAVVLLVAVCSPVLTANAAGFKDDGVLAGFCCLGQALLKRAGHLRAKDGEIGFVCE